MENSMWTPEAVTRIRDLCPGIGLVPLADGKKCLEPGWTKKLIPTSTLCARVRDGARLGLRPGTVGLFCLDVDEGSPDAVTDIFGRPFLQWSTPSGGQHLFYGSANTSARKRKFSVRSEDGYAVLASGDNISSTGQVVVYDPDALERALKKGPPPIIVDPSRLPNEREQESFLKDRNNGFFREACRAIESGDSLERETVFYRFALMGLRDWEMDETWKSAEARVADGGGGDPEEDAPAGNLPVIPVTRAGFLEILKLSEAEIMFDLRFNSWFYKWGKEDWHPVTDADESAHLEELAELARMKKGKKFRRWEVSIKRYCELRNSVQRELSSDLFIDYLEGLPKWDGKARLCKVLIDKFGAEPGPLAEWCGVAPFLGAVWRAYNPGYRIREIPILIGPQERGKSAFLEWMIPAAYRDDWYGDKINFATSDLKMVEAVLGRVVVEWAELKGLRRAGLDVVKSFITGTRDGGMRLAYGRNPARLPRRFVMVGTTNEMEDLPNDPTGGSRFVPVVLKGCRIEPYMDRNRDQMWAEALALYRKKVKPGLPAKHKKLQAEAFQTYRHKDHRVEGALEKLIRNTSARVLAKGVSYIDILELAGLEGKGISDRRISTGLRQLGFQKKRADIKGVRQTIWVLGGST